MPNRSRKNKPRLPDPNTTAFGIIQAISGETQPVPPADGKDPAAVALGRKGGLKGGRARADAMTPKQRSEAARMAALERWKKQGKGSNGAKQKSGKTGAAEKKRSK